MALGFAALRRLCQTAVADGVVPGLVVIAAGGGRTRLCEAFGFRQITPRRVRTDTDTLYDVASLSKALVTSVVAMQHVGRGSIALEDPVRRHLREFRGKGKSKVRVRDLLAHASGLPAHRPFWRAAADAASLRWAIALLAAHEPLVYPPGRRSVYSDVGFIVLGSLLERVGGFRLDVQAIRGLFEPLALESTTFVNLGDSGTRAHLLAARDVAATELCPERRRVMVGEVHDLNAWAMGGIAGHAGLFATAGDVAAIAAGLVAAWKGARGSVVNRDVVREFWKPARVPDSTWRLGWDGPAAQGSLAGTRLARRAIGHLAFTGCSLWIDPDRETWVVMLSNRIHPTVRDDPRFAALRPAVMDAALAGLGYRP